MTETKKIALVTGANKGIGFEIARQLGQQGIIVLLGARDQGRREAAIQQLQTEGSEVVGVALDVTSQTSINAAAALIDTTYGRLDILVNNAAISLPAGRAIAGELDIDVLRATYETNVFGPFAVTKAMLPLLKRSEAGRIVNMSTQLGSLSMLSDPDSFVAKAPPVPAYNSSKTALNALTVAFASELHTTAIKINSVSPGFCATDLNGHRGFMTAAEGAKAVLPFALLPADGPSGGFFGSGDTVPW
ncbi:dehydrogenase [Reticulibacter mediterranei]|uniref:Dehydrogenase n=2 Tax=Reticulibacter mediterranei TaxID=2778369 RepID=A0A8J3N762_9CHLR|nr:dehydrogenase [Reticulibacter mediterranei]